MTTLVNLIKEATDLPSSAEVLLTFRRNGERVLVHELTDMDLLSRQVSTLELFMFAATLTAL